MWFQAPLTILAFKYDKGQGHIAATSHRPPKEAQHKRCSMFSISGDKDRVIITDRLMNKLTNRIIEHHKLLNLQSYF